LPGFALVVVLRLLSFESLGVELVERVGCEVGPVSVGVEKLEVETDCAVGEHVAVELDVIGSRANVVDGEDVGDWSVKKFQRLR
jgi:hypothetical protein